MKNFTQSSSTSIAVVQNNLDSLKKKISFYEKDNILLKHQVKDMEMSLMINKEIIGSLLQGAALEGDVQKIIQKFREDNENMYA